MLMTIKSELNWIENIILIVISNVKGLTAETERQNHMIEYLLHNRRDKSQTDSLDKKLD